MKNITCHPACRPKPWRRLEVRVSEWLLGIFFLIGCVPSEFDTGAVQVLAVVDGDTIITTIGTVRLIGIDTPEKGECGYQEATEKLTALVDGKDVNLVPDSLNQDRDKYGRYLRYVESDGRDVGEVLLKENYADLYPWFPAERLEQYRSIIKKAPRGRLVGCD
ncbi:thermonuclease family protein [Candidatus Peregrinibacteria bacterium]|nr:thermonuclease family protein [Candidatus Peregrinibacteria bacterium]